MEDLILAQNHAGRIELTMNKPDRFRISIDAAQVELRISLEEIYARETRIIREADLAASQSSL